MLRLNVEDVRDVLMLQVKDSDTIGSSPLGDCSLSLAELRHSHGTEPSLESLFTPHDRCLLFIGPTTGQSCRSSCRTSGRAASWRR